VQGLQSAIAFVKAHGNELEQLRLRLLLGEQVERSRAVDLIAQTQRADGGWAPLWVDASALDSTCFRLAQLEQLDVTGNDNVVRQALQFISQKQRHDGSWEEDERWAEVAPPWCRPGDLSAKLYLTSNCAYWLTFFNSAPKSVRRAIDWLAAHVNFDGQMPSFLHAHWLTAGVLYSTEHQATAEKMLSYLQIRLHDLSPSNLAWLVNSLRGVGVSDTHPLIEQSRVLLISKQQPDGRWPSDDGPHQDVHTTLEAIRALRPHQELKPLC
jgi:prenyltransferase beta subunit